MYCVRRHFACVTTASTFTLRQPIVVEIFLVTASLTLENRRLGREREGEGER
ncbi:hypothetical protein E2C01_037734 [Portunus trituberculatus]|uniref:Uncharacterized protein n=1 Tax=Portunus trituberculatus TaxID=210409 RepID=A0A5B7FG32_PORTR|nr:hypothetical protein [Portunus trituberculatus]